MRLLPPLVCTLAFAFGYPSAWAGAPVRVATNPDTGGIALGGAMLYPGASAANGLELWRSDGTPAGTQLVKDLVPGPASSYPANFALAGGVAYFTSLVSDTAYALWKSDGTTAGTTKVADLPGVPSLLQAAGGTLFFNVITATDMALWTSDGTPVGTQQVRGGFSYLADQFTAAAGKVFFSVDDGVNGEELWVTDGSFEGTQLTKNIGLGRDSGLVLELRRGNGMLLFGAQNAQGGLGLWRSDGTEAGTVPVGMAPITGEVGPVLGNSVLLTASDSAGSELWKSDGTAAGSYRVADLLAGGSSAPRDFAEYGGVAYFTAALSGGATTLFRSDGTAAGTTQMTAVLSPAGSPSVIGGAGEEIFFLAQEGASTRSIWGADRNLQFARKRFELTAAADVYLSFRTSPGGLYFSVERNSGTASAATELWFIPAENPLGDTDSDGVPDGIEASEGLNPLAKDNDIFTRARLFAMQQYRDFLGREGDTGGIAFYTQNINSGATPRVQVIESFLGSPEFQNGLPQCTRLYFSFFLRIPDYAGLMFQVGQYRAGLPLEAIAQNFSNSPEFTNRYGALTNDQYVDLVYQNVLNRAPDAAGRQYYLDRLGDGRLTRGQMMIGFSESPEFQQIAENEVYVNAVYVGMLRRAPDQAGLDFYVNQIEGGAPRNSIINGFFGSPEYRARFLP